MTRDDFLEALLQTMERKRHWAWTAFTTGQVPIELLHVHLEHEFEVYIRDFPIYLGRAFVQCPIAAVRRELAGNLYEEETGGLSMGTPHPVLFMMYPQGLGMDTSRYDDVKLMPLAQEYRDWLDNITANHGWEVSTAVGTIFLEGTRYERGEVDGKSEKRPAPPLEDHPLVKHYGLPLANLELTRAHRQIEGAHRASAWHILLDHVPAAAYQAVLDAMEITLEKWKAYRDEVAFACGVRRDAKGQPHVPMLAAG
ncbi:MAG: hypothetical protein ACI9WU_004665 [Myxococcota bacterium]|jgi:hypothetical protein